MRHVGQAASRLDAHHASTKAGERHQTLSAHLRAALLLLGKLGGGGEALVRPIEQRVAEPERRFWGGAGPADATQCLQGRNGWQNRDGVLAGEPGRRTVLGERRFLSSLWRGKWCSGFASPWWERRRRGFPSRLWRDRRCSAIPLGHQH